MISPNDLKAIERILSMGKHYRPAVLPADISRGKTGDCFDHCVAVAMWSKDPEYRYVEGVARDPFSDRWILHAWLTDGIHAFDPTWVATAGIEGDHREIPIPTTYIGIEMKTKAVAAFMLHTNHKAVIANAHLAPELAEKAIMSCA